MTCLPRFVSALDRAHPLTDTATLRSATKREQHLEQVTAEPAGQSDCHNRQGATDGGATEHRGQHHEHDEAER